MSNIHNYPIESLTFNDDDFYDIDFFNGSGYETRKIKGSTIKAGIQASLGTIYDSDGVITGQRLVDGATNNLAFLNIRQFLMSTVPQIAGEYGMLLEVNTDLIDANDFYFQISETGLSSGEIFKITKNKQFRIFDEYNLPQVDGTDGQILKTNGAGITEFASPQDLTNTYIHGSTQWGRTLPAPDSLANNGIANGCTFFDNVADKDPDGTTSYDEWNITFGIEIEVTAGTTGTAQINIDGVNYQLDFDTDIDTSVQNWVTTNAPTLVGTAFTYFLPTTTEWLPNQGPKSARIRFCTTEAIANGVTFTPDVGSDWVANISNPFTGTTTSAPDHILVPYVGLAYEGQRLHHIFRVNFEFDTVGGTGDLALSLRRFASDTQIGSDIQVNKNNDVGGSLVTISSYTNDATDPFVTGGFYFLLINTSGNSVDFINKVGILAQTNYQKLTQF
jgi:hypothetical protein